MKGAYKFDVEVRLFTWRTISIDQPVSANRPSCLLCAGGERILQVFEARLVASIRALNFTKLLESENVKRVVEEADGYQPHLVAPEMGYRRLLQECLILFKARLSRCLQSSHPYARGGLLRTIHTPLHTQVATMMWSGSIMAAAAAANTAPNCTARDHTGAMTCVMVRLHLGIQIHPSHSDHLRWVQGPADQAVEEVHAILRAIVNMVLNSEECVALQRYIVLKREIMTTAAASLDGMRDDARKMVANMVEMERSYLTAEVFREILASSHAIDELSEEVHVRSRPLRSSHILHVFVLDIPKTLLIFRLFLTAQHASVLCFHLQTSQNTDKRLCCSSSCCTDMQRQSTRRHKP